MFSRLQYFARGLQVYIRQLRLALQGKTGEALKTEEVSMVPFRSLLRETPAGTRCLIKRSSCHLKLLEWVLSSVSFLFPRTRSKWLP